MDGIHGGIDRVTVDLQEACVFEAGMPTWNFRARCPREDVRDDSSAILVDEDEARSWVGDRCRAHVVETLLKGVTITMGREVELGYIAVGDTVVIHRRSIRVGLDREDRGENRGGGCVAGGIVV